MRVTLYYHDPEKKPRVIEDVANVDDSGENLRIRHIVNGILVETTGFNIASFEVDGEQDPRAERHLRAVVDVPE